MVDTSVILDGPMFQARGLRPEVRAILDEAEREVGNALLERVQFHLDANIRNPTPYYETQIIHERLGGVETVHDRGIIYGPWLEGTSTRNQTTRFKGYGSFRKANQEVDAISAGIVNDVIQRNIARLGGP